MKYCDTLILIFVTWTVPVLSNYCQNLKIEFKIARRVHSPKTIIFSAYKLKQFSTQIIGTLNSTHGFTRRDLNKKYAFSKRFIIRFLPTNSLVITAKLVLVVKVKCGLHVLHFHKKLSKLHTFSNKTLFYIGNN